MIWDTAHAMTHRISIAIASPHRAATGPWRPCRNATRIYHVWGVREVAQHSTMRVHVLVSSLLSPSTFHARAITITTNHAVSRRIVSASWSQLRVRPRIVPGTPLPESVGTRNYQLSPVRGAGAGNAYLAGFTRSENRKQLRILLRNRTIGIRFDKYDIARRYRRYKA